MENQPIIINRDILSTISLEQFKKHLHIKWKLKIADSRGTIAEMSRLHGTVQRVHYIGKEASGIGCFIESTLKMFSTCWLGEPLCRRKYVCNYAPILLSTHGSANVVDVISTRLRNVARNKFYCNMYSIKRMNYLFFIARQMTLLLPNINEYELYTL